MLKKTITYKDLDGNDVTDDFMFGLSKAEIAELEISHKGGLDYFLQKLIKAEDGKQIIATFKEIIGLSLGRRSEDGKQFIKNQQIRDEFFQSDAYSVFFMELLKDGEESGAAFIRAIVPADVAASIKTENTNVQLPSNQQSGKTEAQESLPAWVTEGRVPTEQEIMGAPPHLVQEAFRRKNAQQ